MSQRLLQIIKASSPAAARAAFGLVGAHLGEGRYQVQYNGTSYVVPAAGGATAVAGQQVALLVSAAGIPTAMLGVVRL